LQGSYPDGGEGFSFLWLQTDEVVYQDPRIFPAGVIPPPGTFNPDPSLPPMTAFPGFTYNARYRRVLEMIAWISSRKGGTDPDPYTDRLFNIIMTHINFVRNRGFGYPDMGKKKGDTVGHIIGKQFGGPADRSAVYAQPNIFPQSSRSNLEYEAQVETPIATALPVSIAKKACIRILIAPRLGVDPYPYRPAEMVVEWWIDEQHIGRRRIVNYPAY
jgi:hypothetical protein